MDEDDDADLFGSDGGGSDAGLDSDDRGRRNLDDEQLDSGDDEGRDDRRDRMDVGADAGDFDEAEVNIMDVSLARAPEPVTSDGEVWIEITLNAFLPRSIYTMRVPDFLSIEAEEFNPETYVAPPYSTAATSLCWRKDPNDESQLQSNARFVQWEDGSITLQLASAPLEQYRISSKPLAPLDKSGNYDPKLDSHVYLSAAVETASVFRLTSHVTHGLTVLPTAMETDDAVQRLQESLAAATRGNKTTVDGSAPVIDVKEDPEMAARKAELAEKEAMRAERRRQQLADREADRGRRAPATRTMGTGLSIGALEDGLSTRPRGKQRRPNRRGEIYSDEEDYRGGRTHEDEYDEDDGFLVGSDEDVEEGEDDEEEEEILDDDEDAEGEVDTEVAPSKSARSKPAPEKTGTPPQRKKNRYVVDDDDEDE
ncbi:hypothetical protein N7509_000161 [Penicillium cosmopolitanum]|uniref:RNA polymerase-associated protein LEO1 n=1 Tax=Penicillium cosmopolitanum TaxID=1131564 RepID=A0A9X0BF25_9EURO|nr:uncharacterized protein N7509_000161 [Penicillium cosmopolitanum]KAJ5414827.1 hypothetical protein N7509_000161 [Penicillium cosmopolitanum]